MTLNEIAIQRKDYREPVDMQAIYAALKENGIDFDPDERRTNISGDEPEENPEYVYVDNGSLGEAVRVINALGYTTDEDEDEDEE